MGHLIFTESPRAISSWHPKATLCGICTVQLDCPRQMLLVESRTKRCHVCSTCNPLVRLENTLEIAGDNTCQKLGADPCWSLKSLTTMDVSCKVAHQVACVILLNLCLFLVAALWVCPACRASCSHLFVLTLFLTRLTGRQQAGDPISGESAAPHSSHPHFSLSDRWQLMPMRRTRFETKKRLRRSEAKHWRCNTHGND